MRNHPQHFFLACSCHSFPDIVARVLPLDSRVLSLFLGARRALGDARSNLHIGLDRQMKPRGHLCHKYEWWPI
jgi:hypothetical protein